MDDNDNFKWMIKNLTNFCDNTADLLNTSNSDSLMRGNIANFLVNLVFIEIAYT